MRYQDGRLPTVAERANGHAAGRTAQQRLSDFIGDIYDCVLDPGRWAPTLERIAREFSFANSAIAVLPLYSGGHSVNVAVGFDPEWLAVADNESYRADSVALWGGPEYIQRFPLDEPLVGSRAAAGYGDRHSNRYFREILEPRGICDAAIIMIAREPTQVGYVAFNRHQSAGDIGESEIAGLRLLGPHFRRAVTISSLFDLKAIEAATFGAVIEGIAIGVVLVDEHLGIVHANPAANEMLSAHDPIESRRGVLATRERDANTALERAVRLAGGDATELGPRGIGIPAHRSEGKPCVIHVLPLKRGEFRRGLAPRATAAVFVAPATAPAPLPADALALLYELTPAETRIFEMITTGMTPTAIAGALGVTRSTVRTHLLRLFEKTDCKRQVDLVRLAAGLSLPV